MATRARRPLVLLVAAVVALLPLLTGASAFAAGSPTLLRVATLSPDAGPVDVYLDNAPLAQKSAFRGVTGYAVVTPGAHTLSVRTPGSGKTLASQSVTLAAGSASTAAVLGGASSLGITVFTDDFTLPPAGQAKVRVLHAAPTVPDVDAAVKNGPVLFRDVAFGRPTTYADVPPGSYDLQMYKAGTSEVLWTIAGVGVRAGSVYTLAAVGGADQPLQVLPLADAAGVGVAPAGGVATGAGGAQPADHSLAFGVAALVVLTMAGSFALAGRARDVVRR